MLFNIIPIVAILFSLGVILFLMFRKLPDASAYAQKQALRRAERADKKADEGINSKTRPLSETTQPSQSSPATLATPTSEISIPITSARETNKETNPQAGKQALSSLASKLPSRALQGQKSEQRETTDPRQQTTSTPTLMTAPGSRLESLWKGVGSFAANMVTKAKPASRNVWLAIIAIPAIIGKGASSVSASMKRNQESRAEKKNAQLGEAEKSAVNSIEKSAMPDNRERDKEIQKSRRALFSLKKDAPEQKEEVINVKQKNAEELLEIGKRIRIEKKFLKAEEIYIELISRDPKSARAYVGLGQTHFDQGNMKQAKSAFDQAILSDSNSADAYYYVGKIMYNQSVYKRALNAFNQAISIDAKDPEKWYDAGLLHRALKDDEKAMTSFLQADALAPKNEKYLNELMKSYKKLGQTEKANHLKSQIEHLKKASEHKSKVISEI